MIGTRQIYAQDIYNPLATNDEGLQPGAIGIDEYGDLYRFTQIGASNVVAGNLLSAPTQKTNHHNCAATAAVTANGRTNQVTLQLGATAAVANEYAFGYLIANDNSPEGETYRVKQHPAANSAATLLVTIDKPFKTNITTSSEFMLVHNTWYKTIANAAFTIPAAGVPIVDMTAAYFGWIKTRGIASVLIGSAATLGADLKADGSGGVTDRTDALGASAEPVVAVADVVLGVTGEYNPVRLVID